jgi:hypothetical protein
MNLEPVEKLADVAMAGDASPENLPPTPPIAEPLEQAEERLQADAARDSSATAQRAVAHDALSTALRAVIDSRADSAQRLTVLALTASRKAKAAELSSIATLLLIELDQPISDPLKDKARQWLSDVESLHASPIVTPDAAMPKPSSLEVEPDDRNNLMIAPAKQRGNPEDAPAADLSSQILGSAEFARRQQASDVFEEFQGVVREAFRTELDSFEGKPFTLAYSYSPSMARLTHTFNADISVRNFPETETHVFVSASGSRSLGRKIDGRKMLARKCIFLPSIFLPTSVLSFGTG